MNKLTELDGQSLNIIDENIAALQTIFPEAFTEGKVDFGVLRQLLGDAVDDGEEKYGLTWFGKKQARQIALTPSLGTLRPCPEESVAWDTTQNLFIEGDNLEVLKLLQKSYAGKVKMIYIDPPYNTGNEFIYPDKFQDNLDTYLRYTGQKDDERMTFSSNTETSGRYHTNWLNMMFPRLKLARNLLKYNGVIFISIDDNEIHNLKALMNDIFGEENFIANIVWKRTVSRAVSGNKIAVTHDHILCYSRSDAVNINKLKPTDTSDYKNRDDDPRGPYKLQKLERTLEGARPTMTFSIATPNGDQIKRTWSVTPERYKELLEDNRITFSSTGLPYYKQFLSEFDGILPDTWWDKAGGYNQNATRELKHLFKGENVDFQSPKPVELIKLMLDIVTNSKGIILDFFSGTSSVAQAVMEKNLEEGGQMQFIMVQLPEPVTDQKYSTISEIGKERIRRAAAKIKAENPDYDGDLGFKVFKLDSSNIRAWNPDRRNLEQTLLDHKEHLVNGRSEQDVLYELLLKRGIELTVPIEEKTIAGKTVYSIGYGALFACLNATISRSDVEALAHGILAWHKELAPASDTQIVFRDSAFADDIAKTNLAAILEQNGISHVRSL